MVARQLLPAVAEDPAPWLPGDRLRLRAAWLEENRGALEGMVRDTLARRPLPARWPVVIPQLLDRDPAAPASVALAMLWRLELGDDDWEPELAEGLAFVLLGGRVPWEAREDRMVRARRLHDRLLERRRQVLRLIPHLLHQSATASRLHPAGTLPVVAAAARLYAATVVELEISALAVVLSALL